MSPPGIKECWPECQPGAEVNKRNGNLFTEKTLNLPGPGILSKGAPEVDGMEAFPTLDTEAIGHTSS